MLVHILSASAKTVEFLVTTVVTVAEFLVAANSLLVSVVVYILSSVISILRSTLWTVSSAVSFFLHDASAFGEDVRAWIQLCRRLCWRIFEDFTSCGTSLLNGTSDAFSFIFGCVTGFFAAVFHGITTALSLVQLSVSKSFELVALTGSSVIFAFEFVAFLVKLILRSALFAIQWVIVSSFLLCRSFVGLILDLALSAYVQVARLGQGVTFGLVTTVKSVPVDACIGFLIVLITAYFLKKKIRFHGLHRTRERLLRLWWKLLHIVRLVIGNVEFRDNAEDDFSDPDEELDLLELDSDDGRGTVFSFGGLSRASRTASMARHCAGSEERPADSQNVCVICQDAPKTIAILPCRHVCLCEACRRGLLARRNGLKCPICRVAIQDTMKLYL